MKQKEIDFSRGQQLTSIRRFVTALPDWVTVPDGSRTKRLRKTFLVTVVRAIDDHAGKDFWCKCGFATIAQEAGGSVRTVKRAFSWLEANSFVIKKRTQTSNHYRLCWPNLIPETPVAECPAERPECPAERPECPDDRSRVPLVAYKAPLKRPRRSNYVEAPSKDVGVSRRKVVPVSDLEYLMDRIARDIPVSKPNDVWLVTRVAALVHSGSISQSALEHVLESVRGNSGNIANAPAYFRGAVIQRCFENERDQFEDAVGRLQIVKSMVTP